MGTWGVGVFESDLTEDLRAEVTAKLADGTPVDNVVRAIIRSKVLDDPDDGPPSLFALAETLHDLGRPHEALAARARKALANGGDLSLWSKADKKARAAELERLKKKLDRPAPRPKKLVPERRAECELEVGDVIALDLPKRRRAALVVAEVERSQRGSFPVLVLLDWLGDKVPSPATLAELPPRLGWRRYDELGDERCLAAFAVTDLLTRKGNGYSHVAHIRLPPWPKDKLTGETYLDLKQLPREAAADLEPFGYAWRPSFEPRFSPNARDRQVLLSLGAILRHQNDEPLTELAKGNAAKRDAKEILGDAWDVTDRPSALWTLWELLQYGASFTAFRMLTPAGAKEAQSEAHQRRRLAFARKHAATIRRRSLTAWDAARASNVASWCHTAGYITEPELWGFAAAARARARAAYGSWRELAADYCMGRELWMGDAEEAREAADELLADPESPWRSLALR
ncbi:MAG: DUF1266 domain-containing protein [Myxococcales bacterium]|nr:DUF1266 domain-containing protein [Myxococcales bacterium]